jgi:hypothetical protein
MGRREMKKFLGLLCAVFLIFGVAGSVSALSLYVDAAPNVYGSSDYDSWKTNAFAAAAGGTFINMLNSIDPANVGTTDFEIEDEVVYSFGDLGKRLTWIYWIPNATVENLDNNNRFTTSLTNIWDGDTLDFYGDYYGSTWLEPTQWIDYDSDNDGDTDGVIGTAGMAWWGAYGTNTQEALDADIAAWGLAEEEWIFTAKLDGVETSITSHRDAAAPVPEPATMLLFGTGLIGLIGFRKKFKK